MHVRTILKRRESETFTVITFQTFTEALKSQKYADVTVKNPMTHGTDRRGRYTSYEVRLDTNDIAFSLPRTCVRRRFSEFAWLLRILRNNHRLECPELPPKEWFSLMGRFSPEVIEKRRRHFELILGRIVMEPMYLSDPAVHLFLQTTLSTADMENVLSGQGQMTVQETVLSQSSLTSPDPLHRRAPFDRTKQGTFCDDGDVTDLSCSSPSCTNTSTNDDEGVVIDLPSDVINHVTQRVADDSEHVFEGLCSCSDSECSGSLCNSSEAKIFSRRKRKVLFKRDSILTELLEN